MSYKSSFWALEDAGCSWQGFGILILIRIWLMVFYIPMIWILALYQFWRCKKHPCPWSPHLGLWRTLEVPDWGLVSLSWFRYGHWSLICPWSKYWMVLFIFKVQRTYMSFKSSFRVLEKAGVSWFGFGILIMIWIWSLVFDTTMIQILVLYLDFEGAKNIHVL